MRVVIGLTDIANVPETIRRIGEAGYIVEETALDAGYVVATGPGGDFGRLHDIAGVMEVGPVKTFSFGRPHPAGRFLR